MQAIVLANVNLGHRFDVSKRHKFLEKFNAFLNSGCLNVQLEPKSNLNQVKGLTHGKGFSDPIC